MIYEIWEEGYLCTGMEGVPAKARFLGRYNADSFDKAVKKMLNTHSNRKAMNKIYRFENGIHSLWGCVLFDNEEEARKSFG